MEKEIKLPVFDIIVNLTGDGGGAISSSLKEDDDDAQDYNNAMEGIESMILAHAVAGVNIESPVYLEGIETAVNACGEHL